MFLLSSVMMFQVNNEIYENWKSNSVLISMSAKTVSVDDVKLIDVS